MYDHIYNTNFNNDNFGTHYVVTGYLVELKSKPNIKKDNQHKSFNWFDLDKILENNNIHDNVKLFISDIKKLKKN